MWWKQPRRHFYLKVIEDHVSMRVYHVLFVWYGSLLADVTDLVAAGLSSL
jgi:hypothetical protein